MEALPILILVATALSTSAADKRRNAKVQKPDSLASAVEFARAFHDELHREVALSHPFNTGAGTDAGTIHTREWSYRVPSASFQPRQLSAVAMRAHTRWDISWAGGNGHGGGDARFSANAYAAGAFVFLDAIAYSEGDDTVILLLARCAD